jgi:capsular polysaccharide transport system ATP-binding protein
VIELRGVSKSYRAGAQRKHVLNDVSISFPHNKSVGILGLNGTGKSTLIRIIGGVEPPDRGSIFRNGRVSWPLGYSGGFQGSLSGRENARFVARIYGGDPGYVEDYAQEFAELGRFFDLPLKTYSAGMRSRFGFAVSLACEFDCYLVDEAISSGDQRFREKYRRAFKDRSANASVIMVSHNEQTIRQHCELAAILRDGKLVFFDSLKQALKEYRCQQYEFDA